MCILSNEYMCSYTRSIDRLWTRDLSKMLSIIRKTPIRHYFDIVCCYILFEL